MEFSLGIPIHRVLPSIAMENASMGDDEFQVLEQFRDQSVIEFEEYELEVFLMKWQCFFLTFLCPTAIPAMLTLVLEEFLTEDDQTSSLH